MLAGEAISRGVELTKDFITTPLSYARQLAEETNWPIIALTVGGFALLSALFGWAVSEITRNPLVGVVAGYGLLATAGKLELGLRHKLSPKS